MTRTRTAWGESRACQSLPAQCLHTHEVEVVTCAGLGVTLLVLSHVASYAGAGDPGPGFPNQDPMETQAMSA